MVYRKSLLLADLILREGYRSATIEVVLRTDVDEGLYIAKEICRTKPITGITVGIVFQQDLLLRECLIVKMVGLFLEQYGSAVLIKGFNLRIFC